MFWLVVYCLGFSRLLRFCCLVFLSVLMFGWFCVFYYFGFVLLFGLGLCGFCAVAYRLMPLQFWNLSFLVFCMLRLF